MKNPKNLPLKNTMLPITTASQHRETLEPHYQMGEHRWILIQYTTSLVQHTWVGRMASHI